MASRMTLYHSGGGMVVETIVSSVNKTFLPIKMTYFLYWAGMVSLFPFLPVYMSYLGLSAVQTGIIRGTEPFLDFIITPLWGALADKYSRHRTVLISTMMASGLFYCSTYFVPRTGTEWVPLTNSTAVALVDLNGTSHDFDSDGYFSNCELLDSSRMQGIGFNTMSNSIKCFKNKTYCCKISPKHSASRTDAITSKSNGTTFTLTFALMMCLIFAAKTFLCPTCPILDSVAMALSQELDNDYGRQRVWGAISWGMFGAIAGAAVDACTKYCPPHQTYLPAFAMFAGFTIISILTTLKIRFHSHQPPQSISRNICPLFKNPEILVFLLILFVVGVAAGVQGTYLFLFLQELNGPHSLMGLTLTVSCVSEIPFMFFSMKIVERLGHKCVFYLSMVGHGLKLLIYSLLQNPWVVLPIELLHGLCYGVFWPATTSYSDLIAPDGMQATAQTVAYAVNCGFGEGIGTLVGGIIYHIYGGRLLFRASAILVGVTVVLCMLIHWCLKEARTRRVNRILDGSVQYGSV